MQKMDLNTATVEELETIEGIDGHRAMYLTRARPFADWSQVVDIDGIDQVLLGKLQQAATIGSQPGAQAVRINSASELELQQIDGVDGVRAQKLIAHRRAHGPFESWDDIESVEGFDGQMVILLRRQATL